MRNLHWAAQYPNNQPGQKRIFGIMNEIYESFNDMDKEVVHKVRSSMFPIGSGIIGIREIRSNV